MDSCQTIYQRTTSNIVAKLITLRNSSVKRDKLAKTLESHISNGTFPSNLNINVAHFQFPSSTTEEEMDDLNRQEAELLYQFKVDLLTNRFNLSKNLADRLSKQFLQESQKSAIKQRILDEIPTLTNKQNILSDLTFTIETQLAAFIAKQDRVATPAPMEPRETHEQPASSPSLDFIIKEIAAIKLMVETRNKLPQRNHSLNHRDPRAHRRGSEDITDGRQERNHQKNQASPFRRERAYSNSDKNSRNQSPSAWTPKSRNEKDPENPERGSRHRPGAKHWRQPGNQQSRQNSTPYRPRKN
jgi:hypothetical protein